jgi:hypothetical protein
MILNDFLSEFGGRFYVWREFRQILGKEFFVQKCSEFPGHANIICCHQMRVPRLGELRPSPPDNSGQVQPRVFASSQLGAVTRPSHSNPVKWSVAYHNLAP